MAELFRHTDEDGDVFELHESRSEGMFYVQIIPGGDWHKVRIVDLPDAALRRLLAALLGYYGPEELTGNEAVDG